MKSKRRWDDRELLRYVADQLTGYGRMCWVCEHKGDPATNTPIQHEEDCFVGTMERVLSQPALKRS